MGRFPRVGFTVEVAPILLTGSLPPGRLFAFVNIPVTRGRDAFIKFEPRIATKIRGYRHHRDPARGARGE